MRLAASGTTWSAPFNFNPRTPCGVRLDRDQGAGSRGDFNPRTPCGVRRWLPLRGIRRAQFQSTHPMRGATKISDGGKRYYRNFNPRTPCGVRLVLPLAGVPLYLHFNPRTPCGVRPLGHQFELVEATISIHAPHAGCDVAERGDLRLLQKFQSTHPMRGATHRQIPRSACARDFNPRTPCGVRPCRVQRVYLHGQFQSTHPMRGATYRKTDNLCTTKDISIHAPHAGCDVDRRPLFLGESISIHAPHAGCDFTRSR